MPKLYGMVGGFRHDGVQTPPWEGADARKCPKCGRLRAPSAFTDDSLWCRDCTDQARAERRRKPEKAAEKKDKAAKIGSAKKSDGASGLKKASNVVETALFTKTDDRVYRFLKRRCDDSGYVRMAPESIGLALGCSATTARNSIKHLVAARRIERDGQGAETVIRVFACDAPLKVKRPVSRKKKREG